MNPRSNRISSKLKRGGDAVDGSRIGQLEPNPDWAKLALFDRNGQEHSSSVRESLRHLLAER